MQQQQQQQVFACFPATRLRGPRAQRSVVSTSRTHRGVFSHSSTQKTLMMHGKARRVHVFSRLHASGTTQRFLRSESESQDNEFPSANTHTFFDNMQQRCVFTCFLATRPRRPRDEIIFSASDKHNTVFSRSDTPKRFGPCKRYVLLLEHANNGPEVCNN